MSYAGGRRPPELGTRDVACGLIENTGISIMFAKMITARQTIMIHLSSRTIQDNNAPAVTKTLRRRRCQIYARGLHLSDPFTVIWVYKLNRYQTISNHSVDQPQLTIAS